MRINKLKLLALTLVLTMFLGVCATAYAATYDIYNITASKGYTKPLSDEQIEEIIADLIEKEHKFAKNIGDKLVSYEEFKAEARKVFDQAVEEGKDIDEAILEVATRVENIVENLEEIPVEDSEDEDIEILKVEAITKNVFKNDENQLEFAINGEEEAADLEAIEKAGYTVEFLTTIGTGTDGKINYPQADFSYKVVVKKDGKVVAESEEVKVQVLDAYGIAEILAHEIKKEGVKVETLVVGESDYKINVIKYKNNKGEEVEDQNNSNNLDNLKYESSNKKVVLIDEKGKTIVPRSEGTATIIVKAEGMKDYKIPVTVKEGERRPTKAIVEDINLSSVEDEKEVKVILVDQYGDPVKGAKIIAESKEEKLAVDVVVDVNSKDTTTNNKGEVSLKVTPLKGLETGKYPVTLTVGKTEVGSFTVNYAKAGEVVEYKLRTDAEDNVIDVADVGNKETEKDGTITLELVGKDKDGVVAKIYNIEDNTVDNSKYQVKDDNKKTNLNITVEGDAAVPEVVGHRLKFTAQKSGKVTVTVNEGAIPRDTFEIKVVNNKKPTIEKVVRTIPNEEEKVLGIDANTIIIGYKPDEPVGSGIVKFDQEVKVKSIEVAGEAIDSEYLEKLILKSKVDFTTTFNDEIKVEEIGTKVDKVAKVAKEFQVTVVNKSGIEETFTIKLELEENDEETDKQ